MHEAVSPTSRVTVAVVGAGAMGQMLGARLHAGGVDVRLIDVDQATVAALGDHGIHLDLDGRAVHAPAQITTPARATGPVDLVVMMTKAFHTAAAAAGVRHLVDDETLVLSLQNGLGHDAELAWLVPPSRMLLGVTDLPADLHRPGHVSSTTKGRIVIGGPAKRATVDRVVDLLTLAGLDARGVDDGRVPVWEKLAFNCSLNVVTAATRRSVDEVGRDRAGRVLVHGVIDEVVSVAHAIDIPIDGATIVDRVEHAFRNHVGHQTSMLQDVLAGRRTEVDSIAASVVRLGERHRIATPTLSTLVDVVLATVDHAPPSIEGAGS